MAEAESRRVIGCESRFIERVGTADGVDSHFGASRCSKHALAMQFWGANRGCISGLQVGTKSTAPLDQPRKYAAFTTVATQTHYGGFYALVDSCFCFEAKFRKRDNKPLTPSFC